MKVYVQIIALIVLFNFLILNNSKSQELRLIQPKGGEKFLAKFGVDIKWEGTNKNDTVSIEYSKDNGKNWDLITNKATGLHYIWKKVNNGNNNQYLLRIKANINSFKDSVDIKDSTTLINTNNKYFSKLDISNDNSLVIVAGAINNNAGIWDVKTGNLLHKLIGHNGDVRTAAFNNDGSKVITGSDDGFAKIWDVKTGNLVLDIQHPSWVTSVTFSSDGNKIFTGCWDGKARIWDANTGVLLQTLNTDHRMDLFVTKCLNNNILVTNGQDSIIKIWDVNSGNLIREIIWKNWEMNLHSNPSLSISNDGKRLISCSVDSLVRVWDIMSGNIIRTIKLNNTFAYSSAVNSDASLIYLGGMDNNVYVLDSIGSVKYKLVGHQGYIRSVDISSDNSFVASSSFDGTSKIWYLKKITTIEQVTDKPFSIIDSLNLKVLKPNGNEKYLIGSNTVIEWEGTDNNDTVKIEYSIDNGINWSILTESATGLKYNWNNIPKPISKSCLIRVSLKIPIPDTTIVTTLVGNNSYVSIIDLSNDSKTLITAEALDLVAKIWDVKTGLLKFKLEGHNGDVRTSALNKNANLAVSGGDDGYARIWDAKSGLFLKKYPHPGYVSRAVFGNINQKLYTSCSDGKIRIWDLVADTLISIINAYPNAIVEELIISSDDQILISSGSDYIIKIWDTNTGNLLKELKDNKASVFSLDLNKVGNRLISGSLDGFIRIWDVQTGINLKNINNPSTNVWCVALTPDGSKIVAGGSDKIVRIYDTLGNEIKSLVGHSEYIRDVDISVNGQIVVSSSADRTTKIWNSQNFYEIDDVSDSVFEIYSQELIVNNIDMEKCLIGSQKDSIIENFILNPSLNKIKIDSIYLRGKNVNAFEILSLNNNIELLPQTKEMIKIKFKPIQKGLNIAEIVVKSNSQNYIASLIGFGKNGDSLCNGMSFKINKFSASPIISTYGNALITNDSILRLTESKLNEIGAVSYNERVSVRNNFTMKLSFRFSKGDNYQFIDGSLPGADGIALLFQNGKNFRVTKNGGSLGYHGIENCVALEVDMYRNILEYNDPNGNHVALQVPYKDTVSSYHDANHTVKMNENVFEIRPDSTIYYGMLNYDYYKKHLDFYLDSNKNTTNLVLSVDNFDFAQYLKLEKGDFAYIGITSTTGASSEIHEILSWEFCSDRDEFLGVEDEYYQSEEIVQNENILSLDNAIIKHIRVMDYVGKMLINEEKDDNSLDLSRYNLSDGVYFVFLTDDQNRNYYKKIVLSR